MTLTIFTALYNRAHFLKGIYSSIVSQNDIDLEWIIVDDGSTDHPADILEPFIKEANFSIRLYKQINSGKHVAINKGVQLAKGELFFILDSDDSLPKGALKNIRLYFNSIKGNHRIVGITGRRNFADGTIVGSQPYTKIVSNSIDIRYRHHTTGDLVEIYKTEILKQFPFPEIPNEKFCPEALVWNRIAQHYDLLFFNKGIYTTQYLKGGLSDRIVEIRMGSPVASMMMYSELASYKIPLLSKVKAIINFWRFAFNAPMSFKAKTRYLKQRWFVLLLPFGYAMYVNDKRVYK